MRISDWSSDVCSSDLRATIVARVDLFKSSGMNPTAAVAAAAQSEGISSSTLWNWLRLVDGVPVKDRLPRLAPRRQGGGVEVTVDPEIWQVLLSDYLRLSKRSDERRVGKKGGRTGRSRWWRV